jgi:hypothetical protein
MLPQLRSCAGRRSGPLSRFHSLLAIQGGLSLLLPANPSPSRYASIRCIVILHAGERMSQDVFTEAIASRAIPHMCLHPWHADTLIEIEYAV